MKELNSWEKQAPSWTLRKPSARIARRLFGTAGQTPRALRRAELWNWLTPVAACALTLLVVVGSMNHRPESLENNAGPVFFAAVLLNPASSNLQQTIRLSETDENVQWNVWPELTPPKAAHRSGAPGIPETPGAARTNLSR